MRGCKSCSEKAIRLLFGAAVNERDPLFCGQRDPRTSWVSGWTFGSALFSWTRTSALHCPCGGQFSQLLCAQIDPIWQNPKDLCNPKLPMITLVFNTLCVPKQHTLISIPYTRFTPKEDTIQKNLCEVWVSCAFKTSLNCRSVKYVTCGAQSSFHNSLLTFLINCLAYRLLLSKCFWLTPSINGLVLEERSLCF